jgi:aryl-alcohol dehydrogenase-like predicted oxidoreductase
MLEYMGGGSEGGARVQHKTLIRINGIGFVPKMQHGNGFLDLQVPSTSPHENRDREFRSDFWANSSEKPAIAALSHDRRQGQCATTALRAYG